MVTILLPETNARLRLKEITIQIREACAPINVSVIGGHTEITHDLSRPILVGTMIGEVSRKKLVTPLGAKPGDRLLLTKGIPIEAVAILGREFSSRLCEDPPALSNAELESAQNFLFNPGISVLREAQAAVQAGGGECYA